MNALPAPLPDTDHSRDGGLALIAILAGGLLLRVAYLAMALRSPGYSWQDPDGYVTHAARLVASGGWRWTFDAVTYEINGQQHALPPMYSVFLSAFARVPDFPLPALVGQLLLAVAAIHLTFVLGRRVHGRNAGLLAAAAYAVWVPNIFNVWSTSQEAIYIPLVLLGLVLLTRSLDDDQPGLRFALAGAVFGLATLTRSMPMFFVGPAAVLFVATAANRRRALGQAGWFLAAFAVVTLPYVVALSRHFGQLTIIDTHGSIHFGEIAGPATPTLRETTAALWHTLTSRPLAYLAECAERARTLLYVNGGRILQIYVVAGSVSAAAGWKVFVHVGADLILIAGTVLAIPGAVRSPKPRLAWLVVLWAIVNLTIASAGGFGGARLRTPFEPMLIVLAAGAIAGRSRRPGTPGRIVAAIGVIAAAGAVLPQIPRTLAGWPDYGVQWPSIFNRTDGVMNGNAGINVPAFDGTAQFALSAVGSEPVIALVRVAGVVVRTERLDPGGPRVVRVIWPARGLAYVEVNATTPDGQPTQVRVEKAS